MAAGGCGSGSGGSRKKKKKKNAQQRRVKKRKGKKQAQKSSVEDASEEQGEEKQQSSAGQDPRGSRETVKEEEPSKSSGDGTDTEMEEGKKIKAAKKQNLVYEIPVELGVKDVPDLLKDEWKSLMKKDV